MKNSKSKKIYQSFAKKSDNSTLVNTEIKVSSMKAAKAWFNKNMFENEKVYLKK